MNTSKTVKITDVPGCNSIEVRSDQIAMFSWSDRSNLTLPEVIALRDALTYAIETAQALAIEKTPAPVETDVAAPPRLFHLADGDIPADVTKVRDRDGDVWERQPDGWRGTLHYPWPISDILQDLGPVTEVTE